MNDEIKEILETIKKCIETNDDNIESFLIDIEKWKDLLDYITNLQQENERLKEKSINEVLKNDFNMCVKDLKKAEKKIEKLEDYKSKNEELELENKVLKEQMVAMVQPNYTYGIELQGSDE